MVLLEKASEILVAALKKVKQQNVVGEVKSMLLIIWSSPTKKGKPD